MIPIRVLERFDALLAERELRFEAVVIGGTALNLDASIPWISVQDANPDWPKHVRETLADLSKRLGHAI